MFEETLRLNMYENNDQLALSSISLNDSEISIRNQSSFGTSGTSTTVPTLANKHLLNIACTNARSIVEKVDSLVTLFEEQELHLCMLTETWLTQKACSKRNMDDLTLGANLSFIRKDRGSRGGGVAICFDHTRIRMSSFPIPQVNKSVEVVCALGSTTLTKRRIAV